MNFQQRLPPAPGGNVCNPQPRLMDLNDAIWREGKSFEALLEYSYNNVLFNDATIFIGIHGRIACNKFVLKLRSRYFEELMASECTASTDTIALPVGNVENYRLMIKYIYTNELNVSYQNVVDLRQMAVKYEVSGMERALSCETMFAAGLNENTAVTLYQIAQVVEENVYCQRALEFIARHTSAVVKAKGFLQLTYDNLCGILERDDLEIEEINLLGGVLEWGQKESNETGVQASIILERPMRLIRYCAIQESPAMLRSILEPSGVELPSVPNKIRNNPAGLNLNRTVIDIKNVVKYLKVAVATDVPDSVFAAFLFMENNASSIFENDEFLELNLQYLHALLLSDELMVGSELEVFEGVKKWAEAECSRQHTDSTTKNMRTILGNCLRQIRFGQMNSQHFVYYVVENCKGLLNQEEINDILLYHTFSSQAKAQKADSFIFPTNRRKGYRIYSVNLLPNPCNEESCQNFSTPEYSALPYSNSFPNIKDDFDGNHFWRGFVVDQPIALISLGFYGPFEHDSHLEIEVSLRELASKKVLKDAGKLIGMRKQIISRLTKQKIFHVEFCDPIRLKPNIAYLAGFTIKNASMCAHRTLGKPYQPNSQKITVDLNSGVKVTFHVFSNTYSSVSTLEITGENYFFAQLPQMNFVTTS